jgi:hypothetical protein
MLRIAVIALSLAVSSGPAFVAKAKAEPTKKEHSFKECQKRLHAAGLNGMGAPKGMRHGNPTSPHATGWMAQCMRGEV